MKERESVICRLKALRMKTGKRVIVEISRGRPVHVGELDGRLGRHVRGKILN